MRDPSAIAPSQTEEALDAPTQAAEAPQATTAEHSQFALLRQRRFAPMFWTQFLGAMNDNVFKISFTLLVTFHAAEWGGADPSTVGFLIGAIFIAPFVLFSATSGQLADKMEKGRLTRWVKNLELLIMAIAAVGFATQKVTLLYAGVFLMGLHSTIFGPVKYAYLPQHLSVKELTGGNGMVEMGTFVAILVGTIAGGVLAKSPGVSHWHVWAGCLGLAVLGRITAHFVPHSPSSEPGLAINWNPFSETWRNLRLAREKEAVFNSLLGISWLWFFGSILLTSFPAFAHEVVGGDEEVVTLLLAVFSIGIGLGSLACDRLSARKVEIGLVPFGSIGMTVFAVDLWLASRGLHPTVVYDVGAFIIEPRHWRLMADLFLLSFFGGLYSVPLYALVQARAEPAHRARIIAANNIINALFMIVAALTAMALLKAGLTIPELFLVLGLMNAVVAAYIYFLVPEFLMRFLCWILVHSIYRLEKVGIENIPEKGPAVLVCNHVSFVDPLVIMAASPRPIRFVMDHKIFSTPVLSFVFRTGKAIPVASKKDDPRILDQAFEKVAQALEEGELVAIFPEGRITDNGELYPFRPGIRRILDRTPVPVIPLALRGLWGSFFSRKDGPAMSNPLKNKLFSRIALVAAPPVSPEAATPETLQAAVLGLRSDWR